jgi:hypothetical protein
MTEGGCSPLPYDAPFESPNIKVWVCRSMSWSVKQPCPQQASEVPVPAEDEGLVDLTVYGPYGSAAEMLAVHAFFVAKDTRSQPTWQRGVYTLGQHAAAHLVRPSRWAASTDGAAACAADTLPQRGTIYYAAPHELVLSKYSANRVFAIGLSCRWRASQMTHVCK